MASEGPIKLTRNISCQSSTLCSNSEARPPDTPALAKKMSSPPKRSSAVWTRSWTSSSLPASARTARAAPPISAAVSSWPFRSAQTTFAPSAAKRIALARPMPEPAPVTMAILSASLIFGPPSCQRRLASQRVKCTCVLHPPGSQPSLGRRYSPTPTVLPPSTTIAWPVTKVEAGEARKTAAPAISCGSPMRRSGVWAVTASSGCRDFPTAPWRSRCGPGRGRCN
jgi:hypothetical protein